MSQTVQSIPLFVSMIPLYETLGEMRSNEKIICILDAALLAEHDWQIGSLVEVFKLTVYQVVRVEEFSSVLKERYQDCVEVKKVCALLDFVGGERYGYVSSVAGIV